MKKVIFGIFAHPDDEAFGPAGTLLAEKAAGNEIHLITATAGDNGVNPDNYETLALARLEEWRAAGELFEADSMHYLAYRDGHLCNLNYHEAADKIRKIIHTVVDGRDDIEIEFMSMDHNGITGHIDHIFVGRVAAYLFYTLKENDKRIKRLRLACVPKEQYPKVNCDWLYMDAGRAPEEIGEIVDARDHLEKVYEIMRAHHSQRADGENHIALKGERVAINHFLVLK